MQFEIEEIFVASLVSSDNIKSNLNCFIVSLLDTALFIFIHLCDQKVILRQIDIVNSKSRPNDLQKRALNLL